MKNIHYHILFLFLWIIGQLPLRFLYFVTDCLFPVLYYIFPYRKKIVMMNLRNSFPTWHEKQVNATAKKFYHYFFDLIIESFSGMYMSESEMKKRFTLRNPEIFDDPFISAKSLTIMMSHYGNWEWASVCQRYLKHKAIVIYKPLNNKYFDSKIKKTRERFGFQTVAMEKILRQLHDYIRNNIPTITFYLADQRPLRIHIQHWLRFMNQDTPVILGPEKISVRFDIPVFFVNILRTRRGFYEGEFIPLFDHGKETKPFEITEKYYQVLEKIITEKPEYWLWTHKRWKHKRLND